MNYFISDEAKDDLLLKLTFEYFRLTTEERSQRERADRLDGRLAQANQDRLDLRQVLKDVLGVWDQMKFGKEESELKKLKERIEGLVK